MENFLSHVTLCSCEGVLVNAPLLLSPGPTELVSVVQPLRLCFRPLQLFSTTGMVTNKSLTSL